MTDDQVLVRAALIKWERGEQMSTVDVQRVIQFIQTAQINVDQVTPDKIAGLQNALIDSLETWVSNMKS